jgi:putative peptide zinc metalloprotease protein
MEAAAPWPQLREELSLHAGPVLVGGQPSLTLEDPVRNQFFRLDWLTCEILQRWSLGDAADIVQSIETATTLHPTEADVEAVARFLHDNQLLRPDPFTSAATMAERRRKIEGSLATRLLHHYLFFRVPLVKPDRWLERLAPMCDVFYRRGFLFATLAALLLGAVQVFRNWSQFEASFVDSLTPRGILGYVMALALVKVLHELGHAVTAKRQGCRIPSMGLAFLVMWPVPYTDTNDSWKLRDDRARLRVAGAGVATELAIAAWATLAWTLLPDGMLRSMMLPLAATTWIATLALNASPFMRFDGYFFLCDWLGMPNLHGRSFDLARWRLREWLFAPGAAPPEYFSQRKQAAMIAFAWLTWLYRLALFIGVAVLVYQFFIKLVGILLFVVEIAWFIAKPISSEIAVWRRIWPLLPDKRRARRSMLIAGIILALCFVPLPGRLEAGGHLHAGRTVPVFAPERAQVASLPLKDGARVAEGTVLATLAGPEQLARRQILEAKVARLRWQSATAGFNAEQRQQSGVTSQELATAEAELKALDEDAAGYSPRAPFAGTLRDIDPDLAPGDWLRKNEKIALLVADGPWEADAYFDEATVARLAVGDSARFYPHGSPGRAVKLVVTAIDRDASRTLPDSGWVAGKGGDIAARERNGGWVPEHAVYHVTFRLADPAAPPPVTTLRGTVVVASAWEAPALRFLRAAFAVFWREFGF